MIQTIYFDESGFTGNDLLSEEQPYYVYSGVAIDSGRAKNLVTEARSKFRLNSLELKGRKLIRQDRGRRAILWLLNELGEDVRMVVFDKRYALAWKFFEYVFEPVLAAQSSIFYRMEFNHFIAMLLYIEFGTADKRSRMVFEEFQRFMRTYDIQYLNNLLGAIDTIAPNRPLWKILFFATLYQDKIKHEAHELRQIGGSLNWVLDLTAEALFGILSYWGERFSRMEVFCDQSDPLKVNQEVFNQMIGRREKFYNTLCDVPFLLTFNLSSPIKFIDSSSCEGIQIADIVASVLSYAMCNQADSTAKEWLNILSSKLDNSSLLPDRGDINLENEKAFVTSLILEELVERSVNGDDIFTTMSEFIQAAKNAYSKYVISR